MVRISDKTYKYNGDSSRAALKTLEQFLLQDSQSNDCVARAVSRIQCIHALQVILDSTNKKVLQPEESYALKPNYRIKKRKSGVCTSNSQSLGRV